MKKSAISPRLFSNFRALLIVLLAIICIFFCGTALAEEHGEAQGAASGTKGWVTTDTFRVINFVILAAGLFFILKKPVSNMLSARITGIKEQLNELEIKKQAAEKELAQYNEKISLLKQEAEKIVESYIRQGNEAKARILKEAESQAAKLEEKTRRNMEYEFKQAKLKLQSEIIEQALKRAEKNIIEKISSEDQDRLIDEYLEKVVA